MIFGWELDLDACQQLHKSEKIPKKFIPSQQIHPNGFGIAAERYHHHNDNVLIHLKIRQRHLGD
jgi:hypothetical protein